MLIAMVHSGKTKTSREIFGCVNQQKVGVKPVRKFSDQKFMIMRWNDAYKRKFSKIVSIMSTKHDDELVNTGKIHYRSIAKVRKPYVIINITVT